MRMVLMFTQKYDLVTASLAEWLQVSLPGKRSRHLQICPSGCTLYSGITCKNMHLCLPLREIKILHHWSSGQKCNSRTMGLWFYSWVGQSDTKLFSAHPLLHGIYTYITSGEEWVYIVLRRYVS
ncbi:hypothetical protein SFRURICE_010410 [Spodoptera frugiperda]|nr:hypothetical protein SFRURICE_010410 [Spodoptera frugiperda]